MRVIDIENINLAMRNEVQFVLRCEEVYHDKVSAAVGTILSNRKPFVALTGPSGSGKIDQVRRPDDCYRSHICINRQAEISLRPS